MFSARALGFLLLPAIALAQGTPARVAIPILRATTDEAWLFVGERPMSIATLDGSVADRMFIGLGRSAETRWVDIETDLDSMAVDLAPGRFYDFAVRSADSKLHFRRISTMAQPFERLDPRAAAGPDSIPLTIRQGKLLVHPSINGSRPLSMILDTGASFTMLYASAAGRGCKVPIDGSFHALAFGESIAISAGTDKEITLAGLRWRHELIGVSPRQSLRVDGLLSYRLFEDKVMEFDFDQMLLIRHPKLPARAAEITRTDLTWPNGALLVDAELRSGARRWPGKFQVDTGADLPLYADQSLANWEQIRAELPSTGSSTFRGSGQKHIRTETRLVPKLDFAGAEVNLVPMHLRTVAVVPVSTEDCYIG